MILKEDEGNQVRALIKIKRKAATVEAQAVENDPNNNNYYYEF